jgi:hypothetical protein
MTRIARRRAAWLNGIGGASPCLSTRWSMPFFSHWTAHRLVNAAVQRALGSVDSDCCNREFCTCSADCLVGRAEIAGPLRPQTAAGGQRTRVSPEKTLTVDFGERRAHVSIARSKPVTPCWHGALRHGRCWRDFSFDWLLLVSPVGACASVPSFGLALLARVPVLLSMSAWAAWLARALSQRSVFAVMASTFVCVL